MATQRPLALYLGTPNKLQELIDGDELLIPGTTQHILWSSAAKKIARLGWDASAVNYLALIASATGVALKLSSEGTDADISLTLLSKGAGTVRVRNGANAVSDVCTLDDVQELQQKTLLSPGIADFSQAMHTHEDDNGGGVLDAAAIATGTLNVARLGSGSGGVSQFLNGQGAFITPIVGSYGSAQHVGTNSGLECWYFANSIQCTAPNTGTLLPDVEYAMPFIAPSRATPAIDKIAFNLTTGGILGKARIGLRQNAADGDNYPGTLVEGSTEFTCTVGSEGVKSYTLSTPAVLKPGRVYWITIVCNVGLVIRNLSAASVSSLLGTSSALGTAPNLSVSSNFTYAALGSSYPGGGGFGTATPTPALAYHMSA